MTAIMKKDDRELDRDLVAVLGHRGNGKQIAGSIAGLTTRYDMIPSTPMSLSQPVWNNDIQRRTKSFAFWKAEDAGGAGIPKTNDTFPIRCKDGVGRSIENGFL